MKTCMFIDGANLFATTKALGYSTDFGSFLSAFNNDGSLLRAYYYTATIEDASGMITIRPLIDWLEFNGYTVVHKPSKSFTDERTGLTRVKGNMDIEIAVDAMRMAEHVDQIILFSGDGDFTYLVKALQQKGCFVIVVSSIETTPPMVADELRRSADKFIELDNPVIRGRIERKQEDIDARASRRR